MRLCCSTFHQWQTRIIPPTVMDYLSPCLSSDLSKDFWWFKLQWKCIEQVPLTDFISRVAPWNVPFIICVSTLNMPECNPESNFGVQLKLSLDDSDSLFRYGLWWLDSESACDLEWDSYCTLGSQAYDSGTKSDNYDMTHTLLLWLRHGLELVKITPEPKASLEWEQSVSYPKTNCSYHCSLQTAV